MSRLRCAKLSVTAVLEARPPSSPVSPTPRRAPQLVDPVVEPAADLGPTEDNAPRAFRPVGAQIGRRDLAALDIGKPRLGCAVITVRQRPRALAVVHVPTLDRVQRNLLPQQRYGIDPAGCGNGLDLPHLAAGVAVGKQAPDLDVKRRERPGAVPAHGELLRPYGADHLLG